MVSHHRLIDLFLDMQRAERAASPHTIAAYRADLNKLAHYHNTHNSKKNHLDSQKENGLETLSTDDLRDFFVMLIQDGLVQRSRQRVRSTLNQFYQFLYQEGITKTNPVLGLESPKREQSLPKQTFGHHVELLFQTGYDLLKNAEQSPFEALRLSRILRFWNCFIVAA